MLDADESHYRRVFRQVLTALQSISDRVEDAGLGLNSLTLGVAYVALDGLESMYGGEERLVLALLNSVPRYLAPRAGIGQGKFPAMVAARSSDSPSLFACEMGFQVRARKVPPDAAAFLSPRPVALLPVSENTISALHRFGLHTLGQVAAMDVDRLVDQFGREGEWLWEPGQRPRRPRPGPAGVRGNGDRGDLAALLLDVAGDAAGGVGHAAAPRLRPASHAGAVRRAGFAGVPGLRLGSMGEDGQFPGERGTLGACRLHRAQPPGGRAARSPGGRSGADAVELHWGVGVADQPAARRSRGPAGADHGGGAAPADPAGFKAPRRTLKAEVALRRG